ncbi:sensitivity to high expression protein she9, partial [Serendipita sp. 399]
ESSANGKKEGDQLEIVHKLKEWQETAKKNGNERLAIWKSTAEQNLASLGNKLNQLTGYELVEELKRQVVKQETRIEQAKLASRAAKLAYESAVAERSKCQKEVNDLLQRKSSWSDADVVRFTNLVRLDHGNEQAEARAKSEVAQTDLAIEQEFQNLTRAILNRYHEEQVWSDKIRSASTYGSLLALGLNLIVFFLAIIIVEPYKRKRMAETFERRVEVLSSDTKEILESISTRIESRLSQQDALLNDFVSDHRTEANDVETKSNMDTIRIPVKHREKVAAGIGAAAALVFIGIVSLFRG